MFSSNIFLEMFVREYHLPLITIEPLSKLENEYSPYARKAESYFGICSGKSEGNGQSHVSRSSLSKICSRGRNSDCSCA